MVATPRIRTLRAFVRCLGVVLATCANDAVAAAIALQPQWLTTVPAGDCLDLGEWNRVDLTQGSQDASLLRSRPGVVRIERDGTQAWAIPTCPGCLDPSPRDGEIADVASSDDGTVWLTERQYDPEPYHLHYLVHRVDALGNIAQTVALPVSNDTRTADIGRSVASGGTLVAVFSTRPRGGWFWQNVAWVSTDASGVVQENTFDAEFAMQASIVGLHALSDGGVIAAVERRNAWYCAPLQPCDEAARLLLLRIGADGSELWRVRADDLLPQPAFEPDGAAWFMQYGGGLVRISAHGVRSASHPIALEPYEQMYALHGPVDERLLLVSDHGFRAFDLQGRPRATRLIPGAPMWDDVDWYIDGIAATATGFLLPRFGGCTVATVLDPQTLADRFDLQLPTQCDSVNTHLLSASSGFDTADGAIHLAMQRSGEHCGVAAARFGLPGTPAGGLMMRDGFEPDLP